jgi:hypothetical protein
VPTATSRRSARCARERRGRGERREERGERREERGERREERRERREGRGERREERGETRDERRETRDEREGEGEGEGGESTLGPIIRRLTLGLTARRAQPALRVEDGFASPHRFGEGFERSAPP